MGEGGPPHTPNRLQLWLASLCSELTWHSLTALSPGCHAKSRAPALPSPGTAARKEAGGTPMRDCTSAALACLRMQPVSPWQLGMLPSPGPTGSHLPSRHVELIGRVNRASPSPTQPPPSPEPCLTQSTSSAAFCRFLQSPKPPARSRLQQNPANGQAGPSPVQLPVEHHPWP